MVGCDIDVIYICFREKEQGPLKSLNMEENSDSPAAFRHPQEVKIGFCITQTLV